jgi:hypothetical protein
MFHWLGSKKQEEQKKVEELIKRERRVRDKERSLEEREALLRRNEIEFKEKEIRFKKFCKSEETNNLIVEERELAVFRRESAVHKPRTPHTPTKRLRETTLEIPPKRTRTESGRAVQVLFAEEEYQEESDEQTPKYLEDYQFSIGSILLVKYLLRDAASMQEDWITNEQKMLQLYTKKVSDWLNMMYSLGAPKPLGRDYQEGVELFHSLCVELHDALQWWCTTLRITQPPQIDALRKLQAAANNTINQKNKFMSFHQLLLTFSEVLVVLHRKQHIFLENKLVIQERLEKSE